MGQGKERREPGGKKKKVGERLAGWGGKVGQRGGGKTIKERKVKKRKGAKCSTKERQLLQGGKNTREFEPGGRLTVDGEKVGEPSYDNSVD